MNICVPINQRIEDIAKRHNLAPKTVATIVGTWREEDPDGRYDAYPEDEYFDRVPKEEINYIESVNNLIDVALAKLEELNKNDDKYIIGFHGGQRFNKPDRKFQYTGEFRNPDIRRIAESMGARYEGEMLFFTPEKYGEYELSIEDAAYNAGRYAFNYGYNTPTLYAYLIPRGKANFTDRGFGEVGLSYDDIDAGNYIEAGRINLEQLKKQFDKINIDIERSVSDDEQIVIVAPYFRNRLTSKNKEKLQQNTQIIKERAEKLAETIGLEIESINPTFGTYLSKSEISYSYLIKSNDYGKIDLFASLMGDLSFEYQDAVIASNYVTQEQWLALPDKNKALEIAIKTPENTSIEEIESFLSENDINGSTFYFKNNILTITAFSSQEADNIISKIIKSNETRERKFEPTGFTRQNSRYLDNDSRRNIYKEWLSSERNRENRKLYNACNKALKICEAAGKFSRADQEQQRIIAAKKASDDFDETLRVKRILQSNQVQTPKLNQNFSPTLSDESTMYNIFGSNLQARIDMISRDFSNFLNKLRREKIQEIEKQISKDGESEELKEQLEVLKQNNYEDKKTVLRLVGGPDAIIQRMIQQYGKYAEQGNNIVKVDQNHVKSEYRKVLDNFKQLYEASQVEIEKINGIHTDVVDEVDDVDEDGRDGASGNEGWGVKWHMVDLYETTSSITRGIISQVPKLSSDGKTKVTDDLGNTVYMDENEVHKILVDILSEIEVPEDFCVYDRDQDKYVSFPLLERANKKYKWITPIITYLKSHPEQVDAIYADFRNDYFQYKTIKTVSDKLLQKNVTRLINTNEKSSVEGQLDNIQSNILNGFILNKELTVYDGKGNLTKEHIDALQDAIKKFKVDTKYISKSEDITDKIVKDFQNILNAIGYSVSKDELKSVLKDSDNIKETIDNTITSVFQLVSKLKKQNNPDYRIYNDNRGYYTSIIEQIGKINANLIAQNFRQNGNTYTSYTKPNFLSATRKLIKGQHWRERLDFYRSDRTFINPENNRFWFEWMNMFENDPDVRKKFDLFYVNQIDNIDYTNWTRKDIYKAFTEFYFFEQKQGFGAYNSPILADSPVSVFVQMPKYEDDVDSSFENKMLPLFRRIVKFELARMRRVEDQNNTDSKYVSNFNSKKGGLKFRFFPELNTLRGSNGNLFIEEYLRILNEESNASQKIDNLIDNSINYILNNITRQYIDNLRSTKYISIDQFGNTVNTDSYQEIKRDLVDNNVIAQNISDETFERRLKEFVWNNTFAEMNIVHLFGVDPAYTKSGVDFQKRWKQIYASGIKPNVAGKYGKQTQNVIYLSDEVFRSKRYDDIKYICDQQVLKGKITTFDRDCILNIFNEVNNSDAQALRSQKSFEQIMRMVGKWNDVRDSFDRMRNGQWDIFDFNKVYQTIKPFTYTLTQESDGLGGTQIVPHHNKNSEFLLLAMFNIINADLNRSERLKGLSRFMEESGIDVVMYESAVKLGASGVINLNYSKERVNKAVQDSFVNIRNKQYSFDKNAFESKYNDFDNIMHLFEKQVDDNKITQDELNSIFEYFQMDADEVYNELVSATNRTVGSDGQYRFNDTVHIQNLNDWGIITPTPQHFFDSMSVDGSQERNIIPADLPDDFKINIKGKEMDKQQFLNEYFDLYTENYACSFFGEIDKSTGKRKGGFIDLILDENGNFDATKLTDNVRKIISESSQYSRQLQEAVQIRPDGKTRLPYSSPQMYQLQQLVFSQAKNKIIKRKTKGASAILVSGIGMTSQLNVVYEYKDGSGKRISLQEAKKLGLDDTQVRPVGVECFMPASVKKVYQNYLVEHERYSEVNGKIVKEKYVALDYDRLKKDCPEALKALGFRIPTENKYSITPLIIKGFLPEQNGSSIMVAADITALTGCDFDVDKMFLYFYETYFDKKGNLRAVKYDPTTQSIQQMDKAQRSNYLFDMKYGIMTHKDTLAQFQNPGNFEKLKIYSRISYLLQHKDLLDQFMQESKKSNTFEYLFRQLFDGNPKKTLKILDDFISIHEPEKNICTLDTFVYNHEQNMAGGNLIGVYAVGGSQHMKYQDSNILLSNPVNINGKSLQMLDMNYTQDGWLISKLLSEFLAASVDNVKDPVLANMLQNLETANFAIYLIRLGMNMEEVTLIFNNPYLVNLYKETGSFNDLGDVISNLMKNVDNGGRDNRYKYNRLTPKSIDSKTLYAAQEQVWTDHRVTIDQVLGDKGLSTTIGTLLFIDELLYYSRPISALTRISKFDSPKNAPSTLVDSMKHGVNIRRYNSKMNDYSKIYLNLPTVKLYNPYRDDKMNLDIDDARNFVRSGAARINQASFTFGYDLPLKVISEYVFQQNNRNVQKLFNRLGLSVYELDDFYEKLMYFNLLDTQLFGDDEQNSFAEKYNYYINEFPARFMQIKKSNEAINQIPVIQMMNLENNRIVLKRSGRLTQADKDVLTRNFDQMLFSGDPEQMQLAFDLFKYSFYREKLGVDHSSFGQLFSVQFIEQFPEYIQSCEDIKAKSTDEWLKKFENYYVLNHIDQFAKRIKPRDLKPGPKGQIILKQKREDEERYLYLVPEQDDNYVDFGYEDNTPKIRYYMRDDYVSPDNFGFVYNDITDMINSIMKNEIYYAGDMPVNEVNDIISSRLQFTDTNIDNQDNRNQVNTSSERTYPQDATMPINMDGGNSIQQDDNTPTLYQSDGTDNTDENKQKFCIGEFDIE